MQSRRLITGIEIPRKKGGLPVRFQEEDDQVLPWSTFPLSLRPNH
ncbi:hypothetical protein OCO_39670 [Mycobacterium intracellulare MOTT-02]|nr:hypothetical protein OCO_39670 [Mycobacterium intracellulare MOTT-02]